MDEYVMATKQKLLPGQHIAFIGDWQLNTGYWIPAYWKKDEINYIAILVDFGCRRWKPTLNQGSGPLLPIPPPSGRPPPCPTTSPCQWRKCPPGASSASLTISTRSSSRDRLVKWSLNTSCCIEKTYGSGIGQPRHGICHRHRRHACVKFYWFG